MSGQFVATNFFFFFFFFLSNQFLVRNNFDKIAFNSLLFFSLKLIYVYLIICIVVCFVSISKETLKFCPSYSLFYTLNLRLIF